MKILSAASHQTNIMLLKIVGEICFLVLAQIITTLTG